MERKRRGNADHGVHDHHLAQHLPGPFLILPAQLNGTHGRAAYRHHHAQRHDQVEERKVHRQAGNGQRPHAVPDEDARNDIVERGDRHADNGGQGICRQQTADGRVGKRSGSVVHDGLS